MSLYMETTTITAEDTVAQIQRLLGRHGASGVMTEYEDGGIKALCFKVRYNGKDVPFRLPCRQDSIYQVLASKKKKFLSDTETKLQTQAKNIAWRQMLRWIEAQLALIDTEMVQMVEVFMPYILVDMKGQTLFEKMASTNFLEYKPQP